MKKIATGNSGDLFMLKGYEKWRERVFDEYNYFYSSNLTYIKERNPFYYEHTIATHWSKYAWDYRQEEIDKLKEQIKKLHRSTEHYNKEVDLEEL